MGYSLGGNRTYRGATNPFSKACLPPWKGISSLIFSPAPPALPSFPLLPTSFPPSILLRIPQTHTESLLYVTSCARQQGNQDEHNIVLALTGLPGARMLLGHKPREVCRPEPLLVPTWTSRAGLHRACLPGGRGLASMLGKHRAPSDGRCNGLWFLLWHLTLRREAGRIKTVIYLEKWHL